MIANKPFSVIGFKFGCFATFFGVPKLEFVSVDARRALKRIAIFRNKKRKYLFALHGIRTNNQRFIKYINIEDK